MGNRLHIQTKHEIEYGTEGFNWQIDEIKNLLHDNGCDINGELNDDSIGDWEIPEDQFVEAVKKIKEMPENDIADYFDDDYVDENKAYFKKYVVNLLENFVNTGDHRSGFYHFSWF